MVTNINDVQRSGEYFLSGKEDPTITPIFGFKGTIYARVGPQGGGLYQKLDDGTTTNWILNSPTPPTIGANLELSNLISPTKLNQSIIPGPGLNNLSLGTVTNRFLDAYFRSEVVVNNGALSQSNLTAQALYLNDSSNPLNVKGVNLTLTGIVISDLNSGHLDRLEMSGNAFRLFTSSQGANNAHDIIIGSYSPGGTQGRLLITTRLVDLFNQAILIEPDYVSYFWGSPAPSVMVDPTVVDGNTTPFLIGSKDVTTDIKSTEFAIITGSNLFNNSLQTTGKIYLYTGYVSTSNGASSGGIEIGTGDVFGIIGSSGPVFVRTGMSPGTTGGINFETGQSQNGFGGSITLRTGAGPLGRGEIFLDALNSKINLIGLVDAYNNFIKNVLDPVDPQDAATKIYVDNTVTASSSSFFGGFVNDDGTIKTNIALKKAQAATAIENTGVTANLQTLINNAVSGDVIEIAHNGPYGSILIPSNKPLTIRAASGFLPVFTAINAVRFSNNVDQLYLIGLKFYNCTTTDNNAKGSAICFDTLNYKCTNVYISNCFFERCTGSAINLSYHMSIGGDNYASPYLPSELSTNINLVDLDLFQASSDPTEGAAILLRGCNQATLRRCINDSGDGTDISWPNDGMTRGFMLQYCTNSIMEDCTSVHTRGADEAFKFDQLSANLSSFKNTVTVNRCYAENANQGFDNDDQGNIIFNKCVSYFCDQGFTMQKATSEGKFFNCLVFKCKYGFYIGASVPTATLELTNNEVILSSIADYYLLNNYVLNTNNLGGTRPSLMTKFLINPVVNNKKKEVTFALGMTFFDLDYVARPDSVQIFCNGSPEQIEGVDYTVSYTGGVGGVTRINLTGMIPDLVVGEKIYIKYEYELP